MVEDPLPYFAVLGKETALCFLSASAIAEISTKELGPINLHTLQYTHRLEASLRSSELLCRGSITLECPMRCSYKQVMLLATYGTRNESDLSMCEKMTSSIHLNAWWS